MTDCAECIVHGAAIDCSLFFWGGLVCVVTDMGDWCSRCPAQQRCRGCSLSSVVDRVELVLKPGDNFAIKFAEVE